MLSLGAVGTGAAIFLLAFLSPALLTQYAAFLSLLLLIFLIGVMFAKFEQSQMSSKEVALIGILAAITVASRIPFAALPNIQPCTFLIIATGLIFGPMAGIMVGSLTAAVSNIFLGQGPWTLWQMIAWAMVGATAGVFGKRYPEAGVKDIVLLGVVLGMAYNTLMDLSSWITFYRSDPSLFIPTMVTGLPYGALHVAGNVVFAIVLGKPVLMLFRRFQKRFRVTYESGTQGKDGEPRRSKEPVPSVDGLLDEQPINSG
jgi:energy-coupling factor transport system substrate-specific component